MTGALLVTAGLAGLTYAIVRTGALGWVAPGVLIPAALESLHALTDGFALAFGIGALFTIAGALAAVALLRPRAETVVSEPVAHLRAAPEPARDREAEALAA